ncbi:MAG: NAD(P)/FAD-dependent oxidoreductase [Pseudomonadota bacterium]
MTETEINADYLVVGAGAMGMAFADVLLTDSNATIALVDRLDKPGGHWNHAYPFVRLHQPSAYYGVNSRKMGEDRLDMSGRNKGMMELAGANEILAYFDTVMRRDFLPTGRVQYFPQCEYKGDGQFRSVVNGDRFRAKTKKTVDATYMKVRVPQVTPPQFEVAEGVEVVAPNRLGAIGNAYECFVVVGAGKTSFDSCLYLLDLGVDPDRILWVKPREAWLIDREKMQPEGFGGPTLVQNMMEQTAAVAASTSLQDMFKRVEEIGGLIRIEEDMDPTMYRCATISQAELKDLRRIKNVIRMGRVTRIDPGQMSLERGKASCPKNSLFINCTADGLERRPKKPVFDGDHITLQAVRPCQQLFAAAMIGYVECTVADEARKNELCQPTPHPDSTADYLTFIQDMMRGQMLWSTDPDLHKWLLAARLDAMTTESFAATLEGRGPMTPEALQTMIQTAMAKVSAYHKEMLAKAA